MYNYYALLSLSHLQLFVVPFYAFPVVCAIGNQLFICSHASKSWSWVYCCTCLHPKFRFMLWSSSLLVIFAVSGSIISESYFLMSYAEHKVNIIQPHLHIWHRYQLQSSNLNGRYPNRWEVPAGCQAREWILWCVFLLLVYELIVICMRRRCLCRTRYFNQARSRNQTWTCAEWSYKIGTRVLCIQSAGWRIRHPSCLLVRLWNGF